LKGTNVGAFIYFSFFTGYRRPNSGFSGIVQLCSAGMVDENGTHYPIPNGACFYEGEIINCFS
jgi:hypothetical protein